MLSSSLVKLLTSFSKLAKCLLWFFSNPFKEPGGYCLSVSGPCDAFPGPYQAAWACLCKGGGGQGKMSHRGHTIIMCNDLGSDTEDLCWRFVLAVTEACWLCLNRNGRASCRRLWWPRSWQAPQSKSWYGFIHPQSSYWHYDNCCSALLQFTIAHISGDGDIFLSFLTFVVFQNDDGKVWWVSAIYRFHITARRNLILFLLRGLLDLNACTWDEEHEPEEG